MEDDLDELSVFTNILYLLRCSVKTIISACTHYAYRRSVYIIYTLARETNRLLRLRNTFVYGMTSLLFDKLLKHKAS